MSWQLSIFACLALVLLAGGVWFERSRPSARVVAAVAALAALGVAGRLVLAPIPNVVATTDVVLIAGYALGGPPGFAVGALSALISNFWLGQGPWTPWQMAGWGLVGIGGALLASVSGRRLGRMGLAVAAAIAGLAYGALLDLSTMVSFGGEQSLERYLALSARGIPFNVAHAVGNAAIMLAAGPALVRIVDRYRERFDVEWVPLAGGTDAAPARPAAGGGLAVALIALGLALPLFGGALGAGRAAAADAEASASGAAAWLRSAQGSDGGWGTGPGYSTNPGMTGWAMLGLEAAGVNPRDVSSGGKNPVDFLRANAGKLRSTGDLERTILALHGAGVRADRFAGHDLPAQLRKRQSHNGSYEKQVNLTAFAILARVAAGESHGALERPARWLRDVQRSDGGWASTAGGASEPDSTGAALQALALLGADGPVADGVHWLRRSQNRDGGWALVKGSGSNAQSTAWAVQGLIAAGVDPDRVATHGHSGLDYLRARKRGDGHYAYSKSSDQTPVWVTAQALTAIARKPFPIAAVPRKRGGGGNHGGGGGGGHGSGSGGSGSGSGSSGSGTSASGPSSSANASPASSGTGGGGGNGKQSSRASHRAHGGSHPDRATGASKRRANAVKAKPGALAAYVPAAAPDGAGGSAGGDSLPATAVWLAGLGVLAGLLAGGFLLYRRRLP